MAAPANNLFQRLHKWASRQDENFLTEALAVVVQQFLVLAPAAGVGLVRRLTGGFIDLPPDDAGKVEVHTQIETGEGRPDLEIRTPGRVTWIEVKVESEVRVEQLERYLTLLGRSGIARTQLILLTRHPAVFEYANAAQLSLIRWYQVANWLEDIQPEADAVGDIPGFLVRQLLGFLEFRGMTLARVGKSMPEGVRALSNLLNMLAEAAAACGLRVSASPAAGWEDIGCYLDGNHYWVGISFAEPEVLSFGTKRPVDPAAAKRLEDSKLMPQSAPGQGDYSWWWETNLGSEEAHFFARPKDRQMEYLEHFLRECLRQARSIETPGQRAIPGDERDNT